MKLTAYLVISQHMEQKDEESLKKETSIVTHYSCSIWDRGSASLRRLEQQNKAKWTPRHLKPWTAFYLTRKLQRLPLIQLVLSKKCLTTLNSHLEESAQWAGISRDQESQKPSVAQRRARRGWGDCEDLTANTKDRTLWLLFQ